MATAVYRKPTTAAMLTCTRGEISGTLSNRLWVLGQGRTAGPVKEPAISRAFRLRGMHSGVMMTAEMTTMIRCRSANHGK